MALILQPNRILRVLIAGAVACIAAHVAAQLAVLVLGMSDAHPIVQALNVDEEPSLPTLYTLAEWTMAVLLAFLIALRERQQVARYRRSWSAVVLALAFLLADEQLGLHEAMSNLLVSFRGERGIHAVWVFPYGTAACVALILGYRFLTDLPASARWWLQIAIATFGAGAFGVEIIASHYISLHGRDAVYGMLMVPLEEGMEMVGVAFLVRGLLEYLALTQPVIELRVDRETLAR